MAVLFRSLMRKVEQKREEECRIMKKKMKEETKEDEIRKSFSFAIFISVEKFITWQNSNSLCLLSERMVRGREF
jgi:hypothetical protein